jgi:hypothetical protein
VTGLPPTMEPGSEWGSADARRLVEKAAQVTAEPPPRARARVWEAIERRRAKPARPLWRLGATFAAGALCAGALALWLVPRGLADSSVLVIAADGVERTVRAGERLPALTDLSLVDLHGAGRMVAGAGTFAKLERLGPKGVELALERGSMLAHVTPRSKEAPFLIRTPRFTAKVVGTVLRVAVHADGSASLAVGHGAVELQPLGGPMVLVKSGERWPQSSKDAPLAAELERLGAVDLEGVTEESFTPPRPKLPASHLDDESALYEAGFRALRDQRDARAALDIWQLERSRYPHGVLARDVHASIIDALVALRRSPEALREIDGYLRAEPDGLRAPELHFVRGTLYRELDHGCRRARAEFERALGRPAEPWAQKARTSLRACRTR